MNLKFLRLGGRHIAVDDTLKITKREALSKIAAMFAIMEGATPADRTFFSSIDTSTWSKEQIDKVWRELQAFKAKGMFNITR